MIEKLVYLYPPISPN